VKISGCMKTGAHTVGVAHCLFFSDRLYNFQGTGVADPTMAPALVATLKSVCPQGASGLGNPVALDQGTEFIVDTSYFQQLQLNHGILQIDQELTHDPRTSGLVRSFAPQGRAGQFGPSPWGFSFARSMVKLGNVGVLTGTNGQIRKTCGAINT
jgi:peroxidase